MGRDLTEDEEEDAMEGVEEAVPWTVEDLYRGLVPVRLIKTWKAAFRTTATIATNMATKFVTRIEEFGRTELWNRRCEDTVAWEKEVGITTMSKRVRGRTGAEGHPRSGGDFSDLNRRRGNGPNVKDMVQEADGRVFKHLCGRLKLNMCPMTWLTGQGAPL